MKKEEDRVNLEHKISTRKGKATSLPKKTLGLVNKRYSTYKDMLNVPLK